MFEMEILEALELFEKAPQPLIIRKFAQIFFNLIFTLD